MNVDHDILIEPEINCAGECWIAAFCQCGWAAAITQPVLLAAVLESHLKQTSGIEIQASSV